MNKLVKYNLEKDRNIINFMFTKDRFFKYVFLSQDKDSLYLCNLLFRELLKEEYKNIVSINTHFLAKEDEKEMISDALFDVGDKIRVNIEMQNNIYNEMDTRFDMYLSKMFFEGIKDYSQAKKALQILFINSYSQDDELIKRCTFKDDHCITTTKSWTRITIYLKQIKKIVAIKGIEELNEFEKLIYIFAQGNIYDIIESEKRTGKRTSMVEIMERKTDDFLSLLDEKMRLFNEYHKELEQRARIEQGIKLEKENSKKMLELENKKNKRKNLDLLLKISNMQNIDIKLLIMSLELPKDEQEKYLSLLEI